MNFTVPNSVVQNRTLFSIIELKLALKLSLVSLAKTHLITFGSMQSLPDFSAVSLV